MGKDGSPSAFFRRKMILVMLGLTLSVIMLEAGLRLSGFVLTALKEHRNKVALYRKGAYRILCLGESTTAGQYTPFLQEALDRSNKGVEFSVIDRGQPGINTSIILNRLEHYIEKYSPNMVITMMGVNDRGAHMPDAVNDISTLRSFFKSMRTFKLVRLLRLHLSEGFVASFSKTGLQKDKPEIQSNGQEGKSDIYIEMGEIKRRQVRLKEAEDFFMKAILFDRENFNAYIRLGQLYKEQARYDEAEYMMKKAIELSPGNNKAYIELGICYREQWKSSEAEAAFKKATALVPDDYEAYVNLGILYQGDGRLGEAESSYRKAISLEPENPDNSTAYHNLGIILVIKKEKSSESEELFRKALELDPDLQIYYDLGQILLRYDMADEAISAFKKTVEVDPENYWANSALEAMYRSSGDELAEKYGAAAASLRSGLHMTTANYIRLREILGERGITYVAAQYPLRSIELLKKIFEGNSDGIIFVDNEKVFREALEEGEITEYFRDVFAGDFGHATDKGNRLLGENIARVILKEVFE